MDGASRLGEAGALVAGADVVDVIAAGDGAEDSPEDAGEAAARQVGTDGDQRDSPGRPRSQRVGVVVSRQDRLRIG